MLEDGGVPAAAEVVEALPKGKEGEDIMCINASYNAQFPWLYCYNASQQLDTETNVLGGTGMDPCCVGDDHHEGDDTNRERSDDRCDGACCGSAEVGAAHPDGVLSGRSMHIAATH